MSCKKREGSEQGRWERWEGSDKKGGRVVRSERLEGSEVARWKTWQGGKGGRVVRWEKGEVPGFIHVVDRCKVGPRFHLLVSDVAQRQNEEAGWVQDYLTRSHG